jgi:hypothetical protein
MVLEMEFGPAIVGSRIVVIVRVVVLLPVHLIGMMIGLIGFAVLTDVLMDAVEVSHMSRKL